MTLSIVVPRAARALPSLPRAVQQIARLCDGHRTLDAVCTSSALDADVTRRVVERLLELGIVAPARALGFEHDDERFFASPFDPLQEDVYED